MSNEAKRRLFGEIFSRCLENSKWREIFLTSGCASIRGDKEKSIYEVRAEFSKHIPQSELCELEADIVKEYAVSYIKIIPQYPKELFSTDLLPEVISEAGRRGAVTNGFFRDYEASLDGNALTVSIPFTHGGLDLLSLANTEKLIAEVILDCYSLELNVRIEQSDDYKKRFDDFLLQQEEYLKSIAKESAAAYAAYDASRSASESGYGGKNRQQPQEKAPVDPDAPVLARKISLFECPDHVITEEDGTLVSGKMRFDVSSPETIYGGDIDISKAVPIRTLTEPRRNVVILGRVVEIATKESFRGDKMKLTVTVTDNDTSIYIKANLEIGAAAELTEIFKKGMAIAAFGSLRLDNYDNELYMTLGAIKKIKRIRRKDISDDKRVELHMHTNMSQMDALIKPAEVVPLAASWGHKAIAFTDHGNLQSFPLAMKAAKGQDIKIIYGLEAYFVDDTARAAYGNYDYSFSDEFVVFDIETTGLSSQNDRITEIGAVLVKDGEVLERYNTFVNPEMPIPEKITELTSITDEMVADAPTIDKVLPEFFAFVKDRMLIAHNADFDTSFIRRAADRLGIPFPNSYLDTVAMSRYVNPELSKHKLDVLADYFGLRDFKHHRANEDAEMLSMIFYKMVEKLREEGVASISEMVNTMSGKCDPLKLRCYHQIILVKNQVGLKNLYKLVSDSYLKYYRKYPRIPKTRLTELREGLIIGSACEAGELFQAIVDNKPDAELESIAEFYDYLEIQPISNNEFMLASGKAKDVEELRGFNRKIVELGKKLGKPVVATCDAHYIDPEDDIYRKILLSGMKFADGDCDARLYLRTTDEMLEEFMYLGEETAREVVITNTNLIADMIEPLKPIPDGNYPPHIDGAEEELKQKCTELAHELYGDELPIQVSSRLDRELDSIIKNGFAIMYIIARKLVENSEEKGYQVGSRGSVGSSFAATMAGITKVNPLPPHYRCKKCRYSEFIEDGSVASGFDLPPKACPVCGAELERDGHDIPFETFLGFYGDKTPDIDLNFSGDVQADAHKFTEVLFGQGKAFKAGTIGTLASKTAFGFTQKYLEGKGISLPRAEVDRLIDGCVGVKRTTGQHPGGIIVVPAEYEVYDFTPVQHPADNPNSDIITTHFQFEYLHDTILKLDILGHVIPTKYKRLEEFTNTNILDVPLSDPKIYKLFTKPDVMGVTSEELGGIETGTLGLPEMNTKLTRGVLVAAQPKNFADLLQISGLTHGTGVWKGNADELIKSGVCTISDVIGTRDDIMLTLIQKYGVEKSKAFKIMEFVRKNKKGLPIPEEMIETMKACNVPQWYMDSLQKIRYMFPKAHAAAYVIDALRLGWYKIYYPVEFYAAYFTAAPDGIDSEIITGGRANISRKIQELTAAGADISAKDDDILDALQLVNECCARGYSFLPVSYEKSHAFKFLPEDGKIRLPFSSLPGLGENAAKNLMAARDSGSVYSVEDLKTEAKLSKSVIEILERNHVLDGLSKTNQLSLF